LVAVDVWDSLESLENTAD